MPDREVVRSERFEREAAEAFATVERGDDALFAIEWALHTRAEFGQRVRNSTLRLWPLFPGDGFAYVIYYLMETNRVELVSLVKRPVPISPSMFNVED